MTKTFKPKRKVMRKKRNLKPKGKGGLFIPAKPQVIGKPSYAVWKTLNIFPDKLFCKLKYCESFYINAPASTLPAVNYVYRLNDIYDPRFNIGGKQPLFYDQISPLYERVWVHGAITEVTFENPDGDGLCVGVRARNSTDGLSIPATPLDDLKQLRGVTTGYLMNTGSQVKVFTNYVKNRDILGITKAQYGNIEYSHNTGTSPNVQVLLEPFAVKTNNTIFDISVRCVVKIIYLCQFTNRKSVLDA